MLVFETDGTKSQLLAAADITQGGELESEIAVGEPGLIVMACSGGAQLARRIDDEFLDR